MPEEQPKRFEVAPDTEVQRRAREVQLLLNVVEPDPEYQSIVLTDEASVFDAVGHDEDEIRRRLELYFGRARCPRLAHATLALGGRYSGVATWVARGVDVNPSV